MKNNIDLDQLIKEALLEELQNTPDPPLSIEESWKQFQERRKKRKAKKPHLYLVK